MAADTVTFRASGVGAVVAILDETAAQVMGGYGGWNVVARPRKKGLTQWGGKDPMRVQIPILFDGWEDRDSQEIDISRLGRMALPVGGGEPPVVSVSGNALPDVGVDKWVIETLTWGTNVLYAIDRNGSTSRMRQDCVVALLEYVAEDRLALSGSGTQRTFSGVSASGTVAPVPATATSSSTAQPSSGGVMAWYGVVKGQTLQQIAAKFYGDASKWPLIADANNIRDPAKVPWPATIVIPKP